MLHGDNRLLSKLMNDTMIMKYERIKGIKEKECRRLTGIKRKTFEKILEILKKADKAKRVER